MNELLAMTVQERLAVLAFCSKTLELAEKGQMQAVGIGMSAIDIEQWQALGIEARKVLQRIDKDEPAMLPLPHDNIPWSKR